MPLIRKSLLMPLALGAGFFLLGFSNSIGWITKGTNTDVSYILKWDALNYGSGFVVGLLLFLSYSIAEKRLKGIRLVLLAGALCWISGMLWRVLTSAVTWAVGLNPPVTLDVNLLLIRGGLMDGTTFALVSFLYFGIRHWRQAAEATALAHQAQLQMLRYQLNPHFLFNALNSIRGMIVDDPERSRQMVTELAEFLRYSLDGNEEASTIGGEILAVENYLAIQRIRFEERLDATVQADDGALNVSVPCFLIHPLVENAIKYGIETSRAPLRIRIEVARGGEEITIGVSNTGRLSPASASEGTGTGLKNVAERLKLVFPDRHSFRIWEDDGWVRAEIRFRLAVRESG